MRFRPSLLALAALVAATPLLAACGGGEVTVRVMSSSSEEGESTPVEGTEVTFVPYDRDSLFEELAARAEESEPQPSEELQTAIDEVIEARRQWRQSEQQWSRLRDSLKSLRSQMEGLDRRSKEYLELFDQFDQLEGRVNQLDAEKNRLFERFDSLQTATVDRQDSLRAVIQSWEEEAYRDYVPITDSLLQERGIDPNEIPRDTTDADGYATVSLSPGDWWAFTRTTPGPYEELYWNLPVEPGQADTLVLNRENAEIRLQL
jgi:hypothetical protein